MSLPTHRAKTKTGERQRAAALFALSAGAVLLTYGPCLSTALGRTLRDADLETAIRHGDVASVSRLVRDGSKPTPALLIETVECDRSGAMVRALLEAGADPNRPDSTGETPLEAAAGRGSIGTLRALLDGGAALNVESDQAPGNGSRALSRAVTVNREEAVRLLLQRGADPHTVAEDGSSLYAFAESHHFHYVSRLLPPPNQNQ